MLDLFRVRKNVVSGRRERFIIPPRRSGAAASDGGTNNYYSLIIGVERGFVTSPSTSNGLHTLDVRIGGNNVKTCLAVGGEAHGVCEADGSAGSSSIGSSAIAMVSSRTHPP